MALTVRLAPARLAAALAAGCSQSLFDANPGAGGSTSGGGRDGGDGRDGAPVRPDARVADAGGVDGRDTTPPDSCPAPCAGNAFGDFDGTPDGKNGRWGYVEVSPSFDSVEMTGTVYPEETIGWIGTSTPAPGIAYCPLARDELPCGDQSSTLVFLTTGAAGATHPAVRWTAPMAGDYQLSGDWTFPATAPVVSSTLLVIDGQSEVLDEFRTDVTPGTFDTMITLAQDDTVTLSAFSDTDTSTSLAVNFYITGPSSPPGFQGVQP